MKEPDRSFFSSHRVLVSGLLIAVLLVTSIPLALFILHLQHTPPKTDIAVDFGSRQNHAYPIHTQFGIAGKGFLGYIDQVANYLPPANITLDNYVVAMEDIFKDPQSLTNPAKRDWSTFDRDMSKVKTMIGPNPLLTLQGTPAWLQPQNQTPPLPNYCLLDPTRQAQPYHAFPTHRTPKGDNGLVLYSQLPTLIVAHMDKYFPTLHPNYELWNEPDDDKHAWCDSRLEPNPDQTRFNWYKAIYSASAPLMKAQGRVDHMQIKIGGPTLAWYARVDTWFPKFLDDPRMAPYIDFVSYHQYVPGQSWGPVFSETQDPKIGYAATYEKIAKYVREGKQPHPASTPIYMSEYNCAIVCRTNPTYAPLWNALVVADMLNTVNDIHSPYGTPTTLPAGLTYWTSNIKEYCMFGTVDTQLDCSTALVPLQPYPQYYSYLLLWGKDYLGLVNGGYVANTAATTRKGLVLTDFYTNTKDNVLIINTSNQSYSQLNILVTHPSSVKTTASYYTLNQNNPHIASQRVDLSTVGNGYIATVNIAAYSTVALSLDTSS